MTGPGAERDPLSVRYDKAVRQVLLEAIKAHKQNRGILTWVHSPAHEYSEPDRGGRTASERAFTRSLYYQVTKVPRQHGQDPHWSAKLTWLKLEKRGSRYGRVLRVRLYRYGSGRRAVDRNVPQPWIMSDGGGSFARGTKRSVIGNRVDS